MNLIHFSDISLTLTKKLLYYSEKSSKRKGLAYEYTRGNRNPHYGVV